MWRCLSSRAALCLAAVLALATSLGGCDPGAGNGGSGHSTLMVYVSVPLHGEGASRGEAIENGIKLAIADAQGRAGSHRVEAVYLDNTRGKRWDQAVSADNARRASQDVTAIAYIGDVDSGATRVSLPITNQAEVVQLSPAASAVDLTRLAGGQAPERLQPSGKRTFARVVPADDIQARAAALWAKQMGAKRVAVLSSGEPFGDVVTVAFEDAARRLRLRLVRPGERPDMIYVGGSGGDGLKALRQAGASAPGAKLMAPDSLLGPSILREATPLHDRLYVTSPFIDPSRLPPVGQRFAAAYRKRFDGAPDAAAAYGYETMALLIDAIRRAGEDDDREGVAKATLATRSRRSVLGTYSIDELGDTTLRTVSGYRIVGGRPAFETLLEAPGT